MKFIIDRAKLFQALDAVSDIVPTKTAIPVLSHLLIESKEATGEITISATDLDISITTSAPAKVNEAGRFTVPARKFIDIIRELHEGSISIKAKDNKIVINSAIGGDKSSATESKEDSLRPGHGVYILMGHSPEDYPELPAEIEGTLLPFAENGTLGSDLIKSMISKTYFAVSKDETRPVLNGVLCQIRPDGIFMVATDGHRLVRHSKMIDMKKYIQGKDRIEAIIPPRALQHLLKLLSGENKLTRCVVGSNHILFDLIHTKLFSRLIEGPYVDFEQVIPQDNSNRLCVLTNTITPSVRRVSILSNVQTHQVRIQVNKNEIVLSATSQEVGGEARESIQADYDGKSMEIGYNSLYLLDILKRIDSHEVLFELNTPVTAGIVRPAIQPEGEDYLCLLMPLRISE